MTKLLALYVSPEWRRGGLHSPLINPWWGNLSGELSLFAKEMFDSYQFDTSAYSVTDDLAEADMVFAPYRYQWLVRHDWALIAECERAAKESGLPLLIDAVGDIDYRIDIPNTYTLRIGGYRFNKDPRRVQVPPPCDDLLERACGGTLTLRAKGASKPVVGFAGWATLAPLQRLRTYIKELPIRLRGLLESHYRAMYKGVLWRERALAALSRSGRVAANFKIRPSFSGSARTAADDMRTLRQELVDVVLASDYCLDVRGDANDSTRFFEICSLGRIPVLLDTERPLPFADEIDYKSFCIIVDFRDVARLPDIIAEFHARISAEEFERMQKRAREVFVQYFRIDAQMRHIAKRLPRRP